MTTKDEYNLRQEMYAWVISNGFADDKESAKIVLKEHGFLLSKSKIKEKIVYKELDKNTKKQIADSAIKEECSKYKAELNTLKSNIKAILKIIGDE